MPMNRTSLTPTIPMMIYSLVGWLITCRGSDGLSLSGKEGRYFTTHSVLPPLDATSHALHDSNSNDTSEILPYSKHLVNPSTKSVPVTYTNNPRTVHHWLSENLALSGSFIGFDVESVSHTTCKDRRARSSPAERATFKSTFQTAATVQLATSSSCLVVQLTCPSGRYSRSCAPVLKAVLEDDLYIKCGCAPDGDLISLFEVWGGLECHSRLDLGYLGSGSNQLGLKTLCDLVLQIDLPKPEKISHSDWSKMPLSMAQVEYAARDAWAGAAIAERLAQYDPQLFGHEQLVSRIIASEPPLSELIQRKRRRNSAKRKLGQVLGLRRRAKHAWSSAHGGEKPFSSQFQAQIKELKDAIKVPINPPHLALESGDIPTR